MLFGLILAYRGYRVGIYDSAPYIFLRGILRTHRLPSKDIVAVNVNSEIRPILQYYLTFTRSDGANLDAKDTFIWGIRASSRERVEQWAAIVRGWVSA